jgi:hypothetical protein
MLMSLNYKLIGASAILIVLLTVVYSPNASSMLLRLVRR